MEIGRLFRISSKPHLAGIILLFLFLDGVGLWLAAKFDYDRTEDRARILLQKTAASLDERMKRTIVSTELILKFAAERIQEIGIEKTISSRKEWERLKSYAEALPDPGSLWLLDAQADLLMDSTQYPSQPMNFADREYFTHAGIVCPNDDFFNVTGKLLHIQMRVGIDDRRLNQL